MKEEKDVSGEFVDIQQKGKEATKSGGVRDILNGSILGKESITSQIPYILFLAFLAMVYISNSYKYEKVVRRGRSLDQEVKNLRAESITMASQLMHISTQVQVSKLVREKGLGLEESVVPPKKIKARR